MDTTQIGRRTTAGRFDDKCLAWFGPGWLALTRDRSLTERCEYATSQIRHYKGTGARVLDIGCGAAALLSHLNREMLASCYLGIDRDARRLSARYSFAKTPHSFQAVDLNSDWPSEAFDVVCCMEVIEHIIDDIGLLQKLRRSLRPGGLIIMTAPCKATVLAAARTKPEAGIVSTVEDGGHVRVGYAPDDIASLAARCRLDVSAIHWISRTNPATSTFSLTNLIARLRLTWAVTLGAAEPRRVSWTADQAYETEFSSIGAVLLAVD